MGKHDTYDLEDKAEMHRAGLINSLGALLDAADPERFGREGVGGLSQTGQELAKMAVRQAKANPAGLALIGVGAALLLVKPSQATPATGNTSAQSIDGRIARADALMKRKDAAQAARFTSTAPHDASALRKAIDAGLDRLGPDAREKVVTARLKAIEAQEAVDRNARKMKESAARAHHERPFATGLIAVGVGALIGALLPSTRREGAMMGAQRDKLFRDAEALLRSEIEALEARGKAAVSAAANEASKTSTSAPSGA